MEFKRFLFIAALLTAYSIAAEEAVPSKDAVEKQKPQQELTAQKVNVTDEMKSIKVDTLPELKVTEMQLTAEEMDELITLADELTVMAKDNAASAEDVNQRAGRNVKQRNALKEAAEALTEDEITEIVKMISFPAENEEITEDVEIPKGAVGTAADVDDIEPRSLTKSTDELTAAKPKRNERTARAHGYYILAFSPIDGPTVPFTKLDIIPIEESYNQLAPLGRTATAAAEADDDGDEYAIEDEDTRMISRRTLSRYIRKMMCQIRKGTRKVQRKTRFKSNDEPTVENFITRLWNARQQQQQSGYFYNLG